MRRDLFQVISQLVGLSVPVLALVFLYDWGTRPSAAMDIIEASARAEAHAPSDFGEPIDGLSNWMYTKSLHVPANVAPKDRSPTHRQANQGIGNGPEGADPGNSHPHGSTNDEDGRTPGQPFVPPKKGPK